MKHLKIVCASTFLFISQLAIGVEKLSNKIEFNMPEKFTDFSSQINRTAKDRKKLMDQLTELMNDSIAKYSKHTFEIMVNDIDMVGRLKLTNTNFIRVVNDYDRTRVEFSYKMLDAAGKIVKQEEVNLTDRKPNGLISRSIKYKKTLFGNEIRLFDDWLKNL